MKKISILLAVLLFQTILVVPSLASSQSLDPVYAVYSGYLQTSLITNVSTWNEAPTELVVKSGVKEQKNLSNTSGNHNERVGFIKFVVPEFTGTVTKADLTLYFTSSTNKILKGDMLEIYRVYGNDWDGAVKPIRNSDGTYTPEIEASSQCRYSLAQDADFIPADQSITIDLRSLIRYPGTYSIAIKQLDNLSANDIRILSHQNSSGKKPVLNIQYTPGAAPFGLSSATVSKVLPKEDGFLNGADWIGVNATTNYNALITKTTNLPLLKFEIPEFRGTVTSAKLSLCLFGALPGGTHNISVYKGESNNWDEKTAVPVKNADSTYSPGLSAESFGSVAITGLAKDSYVEIDITGLIDKPGTYTIALKSDSTDNAIFYSNDGNYHVRKHPNITFTYVPENIIMKTNAISKDINNTTKVENISSLAKDEQIYRTVNLINYTGESNTVAILVQYNGDRMVDCAFMPILPDNNWFEKAVQTTIYKEGVTKIKAFVWRDISAMKSETAPITVE